MDLSNNQYLCGALSPSLRGAVRSSGTGVGAACPNTVEGAALVAARAEMGEPVYLEAWQVGQDPCSMAWPGVLCENNTVVGLSLPKPTQGGCLLLFICCSLSLCHSAILSILAAATQVNSTSQYHCSTMPRTASSGSIGTIPQSLANITTLRSISISGWRHLSGQLPKVWTVLRRLETIDIR